MIFEKRIVYDEFITSIWKWYDLPNYLFYTVINACAKDQLETNHLRMVYIFFMESLILAQNERWQRGLGMQVEREAILSILRERLNSGKWRKGE